MKNFNPVRWQNFPINKEIKRLKNSSSQRVWNRIQVLVSVIVACVTLVLQVWFDEAPQTLTIIVSLLCVGLIIVFVLPYIIQAIKDGRVTAKRRKTCELLKLFDEEIIYNTIIAYEFYNEKQSPDVDTKIKKFYTIEQKYYVEKVIFDLNSVKAQRVEVIGDKRGQITQERYDNVVEILQILISDTELKFNAKIIEDVQDLIKS